MSLQSVEKAVNKGNQTFNNFSSYLYDDYFQTIYPMLKIAFSPIYKYELPEKHRFPMVKYELLPEQLVYEGTVTEGQFFHPPALTEEENPVGHMIKRIGKN